MSATLPGPHHCIGAARAVTDLLFRGLCARCASSGGSLSLGELEEFYSTFINRFSAGFDLFESMHQHCMDASASTAANPLARDKILATLLRACGEKAARHAFSLQIDEFGSTWIDKLFDGFAEYVRQHMCVNADTRLIKAYVDAAAILKTRLSIEKLLTQDAVQCVLRECVIPSDPTGALEPVAKQVSDCVNDHIAKQAGIAGPQLSKITEDQARSFLMLLRLKVKVALNQTCSSPTEAGRREGAPQDGVGT